MRVDFSTKSFGYVGRDLGDTQNLGGVSCAEGILGEEKGGIK